MLYYLTIYLSTLLVGTVFSQDITDEVINIPDPNIVTSLNRIYTLEDHCDGSICRDFQYDNATEIAFFDLKTNIRILDESTYEVRKQVELQNLVFKNSTFAHFPLHLFYSIGVTELDIRNCSIETVTWENFLMANKLQILLMSQNKLRIITESTFEYASELQYLFLDENQLRMLVSDSFKGLKKLRYLNLSNNRLRELPGLIFSYLSELYELNLASNRLHFLPNELFSHNERLQSIILRDNQLRQIDENIFKHQANMIFLDISHNMRLGRLILNLKTQFLIAANCSLYVVNLYGKVTNAVLNDNQIVELYFSEPENLEKLVLRNNALEQIASLTRAINLRDLDVADNPKLEYLPDPWSVRSLERLDLSNTSLRMLPISNLAEQTNLRTLNVSCNKLTDINPANFKYLEQLTHFYIAENNWNCYNLRLLMDLLIKPNNIVYKPDRFNVDFSGEYIEGIACMYRIEDSDEVMGVSLTSNGNTINSYASLSEPIVQATSNSYESTNEYPIDGNTEEQKLKLEIITLRKELKAIVSFYETKFDVFAEKIENLN